jgi:hypothetical protein
MKQANNLTGLKGKTIKKITMSNAHGEVLIIVFDDDTQLNIGTYDDNMHSPDELAIIYNGVEL